MVVLMPVQEEDCHQCCTPYEAARHLMNNLAGDALNILSYLPPDPTNDKVIHCYTGDFQIQMSTQTIWQCLSLPKGDLVK